MGDGCFSVFLICTQLGHIGSVNLREEFLKDVSHPKFMNGPGKNVLNVSEGIGNFREVSFIDRLAKFHNLLINKIKPEVASFGRGNFRCVLDWAVKCLVEQSDELRHGGSENGVNDFLCRDEDAILTDSVSLTFSRFTGLSVGERFLSPTRLQGSGDPIPTFSLTNASFF
eukprot:CAMPEP_0185763934 /NCGR_PEP_ID=MMETSP1174-20130828/22834_1 /TAXON_ID=35687 /ORGANISM="Dictyocha speculum, Strain CCMP1381" /LENGTH=169 /DNA_ID=CAMNT_0028446247 /DNA_START=409 /DNA_END=916 /DNA_ORIENTATION=+